MRTINLFVLAIIMSVSLALTSVQGTGSRQDTAKNKIITGADQTEKYVGYLKGKRIAILANPTTIIGKRHLVDSLLSIGINIVKVFGPEHGFRGNASAGAVVHDEKDPATGLKIISLYGNKQKPSALDLADVDLMIFDIQDVGCRFYTYIDVLGKIMEACAENNKELLILDRPNPNGYLVDGPVMDVLSKSGVGRFSIPITHGMTIAEFAQMINGEGWLPRKMKCRLKIIPMLNYDHELAYTLPIRPSPNLNTQQSVLLYPALCLFEGTIISQGRGTQFPFTVLGNPALKNKYSFSFKPVSIPGMSEAPLHMNQVCYGVDLRNFDVNELCKTKRLNIQWMIDFYNAYPFKEKFFDKTQSKEIGNFDQLAGTDEFRKQIIARKSIKEIQDSWEPRLSEYKIMRKKYLLYP